MAGPIVWRPKKDPWAPPDHDERVVYAIRALSEGVANQGQQLLVWDYLHYVCGTDDMSYRPGEDGRRDTDFAEGKKFVGRELRKLIHPLYTPQTPSEKRPPQAQQRLNQRRKAQDDG